MNEAAKPSCLNGTNDNSVESLIDSQDPHRDIHHYSDQQSSTSPTFYTMLLLFHRAFCEYLFDDTFNFLLRDDPYFGINTFGQAASSCQKGYMLFTSVSRSSKMVDGRIWCGSFKRLMKMAILLSSVASSFLSFNEHSTMYRSTENMQQRKTSLQRWLLSSLCCLRAICMSTSSLAGEWQAYCIFAWRRPGAGNTIGENSSALERRRWTSLFGCKQWDLPNTEQFTDYPSVEIELDFRHTLSAKFGPVWLNVRDAMVWLTEKVDFKSILENDRFVVIYWDLIEELVASDTIVRLFDRNGGEFVCFATPAFCLYLIHSILWGVLSAY